ncbi:MAG: DMT family transporter [Pseudomonadota bacterium]|nr:DMT family transporter [Pseudomonadota bacterium]
MWAYGACFLGVVGHATSEFFSVLSATSGPEVSVWRFLIGALSLLIVSLSIKDSRNLIEPLRHHGWQILVLSLFGMALAQLVFHWSLDFASVTQVATMVTTMPMFVVILDRLINHTAISAPKVVSGLGAFAGVVLLLTDGYFEQLSFGKGAIYGVIMALIATILGSLYMVLMRPLMQAYGAIRLTTLTFVIGAIGLWATVGIAWNIWVDPMTLFDRPSGAYWSLITLGVWNTCIGFILWFWGLSVAPDMGRANYLFFLKPVIAALFAMLFLGNDITVIQMFAIVVVIGCVAGEMFYVPISRTLRRNISS